MRYRKPMKTQTKLILTIVLLSFTTTLFFTLWLTHDCPKPLIDITKIENEILKAEIKVKEYEKIIVTDSLIIWSSDRRERDSLRAIRFDKYVQ